MAWDISGSAPLPRPPFARSRSSEITVSTRSGFTSRPASAAGPVIASRNSASLIGPTANGLACTAAVSGAYAIAWSRKSPRTTTTTSAPRTPRGPAGTAAAARTALTNASRSFRKASLSSPEWNNSSNWSTTRTSRGPTMAVPLSVASVLSSGLRPVVALTARSTSSGVSSDAADSDLYTPTGSRSAMSARCLASSRIGLSVGRITRRGHFSDPGPRAPAARLRISPALSSDDLPAPDAPTTRSIPPPSRRSNRRCTNCLTSSLRP